MSTRSTSLGPKSALLSLIMLAAGCRPAEPNPPKELTYGLTLVPSGIDPHLNASAELGIPLTSVYDTLVVLDPATHSFIPALAERWSTSTDGLNYTFFLRTDVTFHDGAHFDAAAVCANLERIANPENKSQKARGMLGPNDNYQGCTAVDAATVELALNQPYAPLLDSLSQVYFGMASPAALQKWGLADYQFHQVGTGSFRFVEYVPADHLTLEKNADYAWGPDLLAHRGPAYLDRIIFRFYEDPATLAVALESGAVQVIGEVLPQDAARLAQNPDFKLYTTPIPGQPLQILLNTQRPPTDDPQVRRALLLATDRAGIVQAVFGGYSPVATGPLSASTAGYAGAAQAVEYDGAAAAALLDAAGWTDSNEDGVRDRDGQDLAVELVFSPLGLMPQVAQAVEANWKAAGIRVNSVQAASFPALREAQAGGNYNAIALNFFGSDPDQLRAWFASDGFYNWSKVADSALDELLAQGYLTTDPEQRAGIYARAQQQIMEQTLVIPVRDYVNLNMASTQVTGLRFNAQGWWPWLADVDLSQ